MRLNDTLKLSYESLIRNKGRAVLTMLGIIIGVSSVILMMAIGTGAERFIMSQVASFGSDMIFVENGAGVNSENTSAQALLMAKETLTIKDYRRLRQQSWIETVGAGYIASLLIESATESQRGSIMGAADTEYIIYNLGIDQGKFFSSEEVDSKAAVAVLGHDLASDLFGSEDPIGQRIKIGKKSYRIIGVLSLAGTKFFTNIDKVVFVPVTSLMDQLGQDKLQYIALKTGSTPSQEASERIRLLLREMHKLNNPTGDLSKDDFNLSTQEDAARRAGVIGTILQILLSSIAAISLVVGGVGIMNIMYVSVTERTREIGLRKAVGAKPKDVLMQFLTEAIVLTVMAGLCGVVLGVIFSWLALQALAAYQPGWTFVMPWNAMVMGFGVSAAIGITFGYFPARSASNLHPIEALRYE